jgi:hypothetical protein
MPPYVGAFSFDTPVCCGVEAFKMMGHFCPGATGAIGCNWNL